MNQTAALEGGEASSPCPRKWSFSKWLFQVKKKKMERKAKVVSSILAIVPSRIRPWCAFEHHFPDIKVSSKNIRDRGNTTQLVQDIKSNVGQILGQSVFKSLLTHEAHWVTESIPFSFSPIWNKKGHVYSTSRLILINLLD